ncbi:LexA family transcriptional regulator [Microvirga lotononidis]|uniref:Uncharacterized protein n=1 Tax=Microvirga lotononidis TaxID=864069 RepID=I4YT67_9HYPH|nr:hypothetical protein [Microvirga lotononidis]EIM27159.1 hypothetical protein MicloDRAFT_00037140 [Microvirga lotononidis]WQO28656.1 hypothetical protein U0023_06175 [Microvirga lotononidis]
MELSETACEILDYIRETHRRPGARLTMATLDAHFGTDPSVAVAVSELAHLGYVVVPDARTIELTDRGFDAIHGRTYRDSHE